MYSVLNNDSLEGLRKALLRKKIYPEKCRERKKIQAIFYWFVYWDKKFHATTREK